jgi:hypothetical protein
VWEYDGEKWYQPSVEARPPARLYHSMTYDEAGSVVVLFGGLGKDGQYLDDTWEYDGSIWIQK